MTGNYVLAICLSILASAFVICVCISTCGHYLEMAIRESKKEA